jgi:hypothetical protein
MMMPVILMAQMQTQPGVWELVLLDELSLSCFQGSGVEHYKRTLAYQSNSFKSSSQ